MIKNNNKNLLIGPLPKAAHQEDDGDGRLEISADGLDVDEELATLTGLDNGNPQNRHHNQHKHKHSAAHTHQTVKEVLRKTMRFCIAKMEKRMVLKSK